MREGFHRPRNYDPPGTSSIWRNRKAMMTTTRLLLLLLWIAKLMPKGQSNQEKENKLQKSVPDYGDSSVCLKLGTEFSFIFISACSSDSLSRLHLFWVLDLRTSLLLLILKPSSNSNTSLPQQVFLKHHSQSSSSGNCNDSDLPVPISWSSSPLLFLQ